MRRLNSVRKTAKTALFWMIVLAGAPIASAENISAQSLPNIEKLGDAEVERGTSPTPQLSPAAATRTLTPEMTVQRPGDDEELFRRASPILADSLRVLREHDPAPTHLDLIASPGVFDSLFPSDRTRTRTEFSLLRVILSFIAGPALLWLLLRAFLIGWKMFVGARATTPAKP